MPVQSIIGSLDWDLPAKRSFRIPKEFQPRRAKYNLEEAEIPGEEAKQLRAKLREDLDQLKFGPQSLAI